MLTIHREGVELVPGLYNQDGSPSVTVDISEIRRPPEDILESWLEVAGPTRLDDRAIDGVTFVGYTDSAPSTTAMSSTSIPGGGRFPTTVSPFAFWNPRVLRMKSP